MNEKGEERRGMPPLPLPLPGAREPSLVASTLFLPFPLLTSPFPLQ